MMKGQNNHINKHPKLEDIPRQQNFTVPEGYFDKLPTIIQARVAKPVAASGPAVSWSAVWQVALPVLALVMMIAYFGLRANNDEIDVQAMIDEIPTAELVDYLAESDITTDELLSLIDINELDIDGMVDDNIELLNDDELDDLLEEFPEFIDEI